MEDDIFTQLGTDPAKLLTQLIQLLVVGLPFTFLCVWATARVSRTLSGATRTFWLFFIWIVPILGPILGLIATRKVPPKPELDEGP